MLFYYYSTLIIGLVWSQSFSTLGTGLPSTRCNSALIYHLIDLFKFSYKRNNWANFLIEVDSVAQYSPSISNTPVLY